MDGLLGSNYPAMRSRPLMSELTPEQQAVRREEMYQPVQAVIDIGKGLYETFQIPAKVMSGEYGYYGDTSPVTDSPYPQTFMERIEAPASQFVMDFGVLPAVGGAVTRGLLGDIDPNTLAAGSGDPLGYTKRQVPVQKADSINQTKVLYSEPDIDLLPEVLISPDRLSEYVPKDSIIIPFVGDQTSGARRKIIGIDDVAFEKGVLEEGGDDFMRGLAAQGEDRSIWASDPRILRGLLSPFEDIDRPLYGMFVGMSKEGKDFSNMPIDTLVEMLDAKNIDKAAIKKFNEDMKIPISGFKKGYTDFIGLDAPKEKLREYFKNASNDAGKKATKLMDRSKRLQAGFPDVGKVRYALTADDKKSLPSNFTGNIARIDKDRGVIIDPVNPHSTYTAQLGGLDGGYVGRFDTPLPADFIFQDRLLFDPAVVNMRNSPKGILPQNIYGSLSASAGKSAQVLDSLFYENLARMREGLPPIQRKK